MIADANICLANPDLIDNIIDQVDENNNDGLEDVIDQATRSLIDNQNIAQKPNVAKAKIIILNKITAKSAEYNFLVNQPEKIGNLLIEVKSCIKGKQRFEHDHAMAIFIWEQLGDNSKKLLFNNWVLVKNLAISSFEHPVYEIIPLKCF